MDFALAAPECIQRLVDIRIPRDAGENFRNQRQNHARSCLMRSIRREVEWPGSGGIWIIFVPEMPAGACCVLADFVALALLPRTRTSGASFFTNSSQLGLSVSSTTASTA